MNKNILKFASLVVGVQLAMGCSPDDYTYHDNNVVDVSTIDSIVLTPNHRMLVADGSAQLDLRPVLYTKEKNQIPDYRVKEEWLEYTSTSGMAITRYFSTSDASLIGKTLTIQVKMKGTDLVSEPVSFQIIAPLDSKYTSEIKIPVIFHIIQTTEDVEKFGGAYEQDRVALLLTKLNNMLSGAASVNPVGVNTHIRLEFAKYNQYGKKLTEPGIDRLTVREIDIANGYADLLEGNNMIWPVNSFMNIWLISDRKKEVEDFANTISENCMPHYVYAGTSAENRPEGIDWMEEPSDNVFQLNESGIIYKLQEVDEMDRSFTTEGAPANNELGYYVGRYLGLLPTCSYAEEPVTDYCDDTWDYFPDPLAINFNQAWYKRVENCYFRAENIMDDPRGTHNSVSKSQCERMRWILENCPERAAWKSDFAFVGKK
ncbi:MAG: hypothetical protein RSB69_09635 [Odoribacter sp.]